VLSPAPYLSTTLALEALLAAPHEDTGDLVGRIVTGELLATVVGPVLSGVSTVLARRSGSGWVCSGHAEHVLEGESADLFVVYASDPDGQLRAFLAGPDDAAGVVRSPRPGLDGARRLSRVEFGDVPVRPLGPAALDRLLAVAAVCLAAEQLGGAERCLELAVEHARARTQFGRPIGSFQAVKHRCADSLMVLEAARWSALYALWAVGEGSPEASALASMAKASSSEAFVRVAASTIQVLGGIGFTWEHPAHRYYRRAVVSRELFGRPDGHRARVAAGLLGEEAGAWTA
jgi:alkylation response protein AidB-like acyl-CoA dehydrogenase